MSNTAELAPLILAGDGYSLEVSADAQSQKAELIRHSALIVEVNDNSSADAARLQVKALAAMRNLVEKSRKAVKDPVLKIGKDIDARAAEFVAEIDAEERRVTKLIGDHAARVEAERQAQIRRQQEEERQRLAEQQRLAREAEEAARAAEAARKAAEDAEFADDEDEDAAAKAKQEAEAAEAARIKLANEQAEAARAAEAARVESFKVAVPDRVEGVKFEPDFEVVDAGLLYSSFPELVRLDVKRAETLARIKSWMDTHGGELPTLPGLIVTKKPKVGTR